MSLSHSSVDFASGAGVVAECLKAFLPPEPTSVADFAAAKRWLSNEGGGYVGRWNHEEAPYLINPMESLSDDRYLTVPVVGPGQCGKTEIGRNWLFTTALTDPADMLWYSGSEPLVATEVKVNIARMLQDHPDLARLLNSNSLSLKRFGTMTVQFLAGIMSNFISKSAPRIYCDEWDMICAAIPAAKALVDVRRQTYGRRSKFLATSHPDLVEGLEPKHWNTGIMEMFRDSTRKIWYWECPHCGAHSSPNPTAKRVMEIHYDEKAPDDEIRDMARLLCPVNGCLIEDHQRRRMNLHGQWIGKGQEIDQDGNVTGDLTPSDADGYWIVGAMSPFVIGGIGALALARVRAQRKFAIDNDRKPYAQVMSKQWGIPLERMNAAETIDATVLAERAEADLVLGTVANGVRFITVMIDVQGNRFELMARGWCEGARSVVVDFRSIPASPNTSAADWDDVLRLATTMVWPLAGQPGKGMKAAIVGFDSAGQGGVTLQAYAAWCRLKDNKGAKLMGRIEGRPVWSVLPLKGASSLQAPRLQVVFPNAARGDRFAQARGDMPLGVFNPNTFKDDLNGQLMLADDVPWSVRFPKALAAAAAPHLWFEQLVAEDRERNGRWKRRQDGQPNEALDLMVGTHLLAFLLGVHRLRWDSLPLWARDSKDNPNLIVIGATSQTPISASAPAPASASAPKRSFSAAELDAMNVKGLPAKTNTVKLIDSVSVRRS